MLNHNGNQHLADAFPDLILMRSVKKANTDRFVCYSRDVLSLLMEIEYEVNKLLF